MGKNRRQGTTSDEETLEYREKVYFSAELKTPAEKTCIYYLVGPNIIFSLSWEKPFFFFLLSTKQNEMSLH
jgi:hypothetical protein